MGALGGPVVGGLVGLTGGLHRYSGWENDRAKLHDLGPSLKVAPLAWYTVS